MMYTLLSRRNCTNMIRYGYQSLGLVRRISTTQTILMNSLVQQCGPVKCISSSQLLIPQTKQSFPFTLSRAYSKRIKENKKEKGRSEKPHVTLTSEELNSVINFDKMKAQMEATLEVLKKEYMEQFSVRTSLGMLDNLPVETPDGKFPIIQLGQIVQKNPQLMMINLATAPQYIPQVKVAVTSLGLNPQQDGTTLFVPIPKVSREHRETLAKTAKVHCDKTKDKLRHIQNNHARDLKKVKDEHSADLVFNLHETLLSTTRQYVDHAEEIMKLKQKELLGN